MEEEKLKPKKFKIIEVYSVLILIATLFMSIGYAEITDTPLVIEGITEAISQEGIFITNVVNTSNVSADTQDSKINYYTGTMLDSTVVLGDASDSSITYEVTVYNKYETEYVFIGAITDKADSSLYSNADIAYDLNNIQEYVTTIPSNESITFSITFKYESGADLTNKSLTSKLNFRFQELPKLVLSNDGKTYELNNIYPGYTPQEYTFTVSNYDDSVTNNVPMTYYFETIVDGPLTAKIYDEVGNEVTGNISIDGDNTTKTTHTYTLKIIWDSTKNDLTYASQTYKCSVNLKATPDSDKYLEYKIIQGFYVNISTAPFYFDAEPSSTEIQLNKDATSAIAYISLKNHDGTNSNIYNTTYEISLADTSKFTVSITDASGGLLEANTLKNNVATLNFAPVENVTLGETEEVTIIIKSTSPYVKEISKTIIINEPDAELIFGSLDDFRKITEEDCASYSTQFGTYDTMYSGNNDELQYDTSGALVLDADNPILYMDVTDTTVFAEEYTIYFTIKADLLSQGNGCGDTIASIGNGWQQYLAWISVNKGYLQIYSYYIGDALENIEEVVEQTGFASYDISEYTNQIVNIQITSSKTGTTNVYVNGTLLDSFTSGGQSIPTSHVTIGDLRPLRNLKFEGQLYDFAMYNEVLTDEEIQTNWEHAKDTWIE